MLLQSIHPSRVNPRGNSLGIRIQLHVTRPSGEAAPTIARDVFVRAVITVATLVAGAGVRV